MTARLDKMIHEARTMMDANRISDSAPQGLINIVRVELDRRRKLLDTPDEQLSAEDLCTKREEEAELVRWTKVAEHFWREPD